MDINYVAVAIATILQFAVGAVWYMPIFGKLWGRIHGFDKIPKEEQDRMAKAMAPYYVVQIVVTFITTAVLALFLEALPADWNAYGMAGFFWLGFVLPTQVSAVVFGGTAKEWIVKKVAIMAGGSFVCLMVAAAVLSYM